MNVTFHFNAPDKLGYACRLLRKAYRSGARVLVVGDDAEVARLDRALWEFDAQDFVPHRHVSGAEPVASGLLQATPIWLGQAPAQAGCTVLVNLGPSMPEGWQAFERVNEIVSQDPLDRDQARQRWRSYTQGGCAPARHEVSA